MNRDAFIKYENDQLSKLKLLPHKYRKVGVALLIASIVALIGMKLAAFDRELIRTIVFYGLTISLLLISVSRDQIEDEMTIQLRAQSYALAFVIGVLYALIQPMINYGVERVIDGNATFLEIDGLIILIFMLMIQIGFYHLLKKR